MRIGLVAILVGLLTVIVFQDFKNRAISWFLIPSLFVGFVCYAMLSISLKELLINFGINLYMVFTSLLGATLIISVRNKKPTNIIDTYLGLGDVLFFLVLTTVFSPINFMLFYIGSIFITALIYGGTALIYKKENVLTPLAGAMSVLLIIIIVVVQFTPTLNLSKDINFHFYE